MSVTENETGESIPEFRTEVIIRREVRDNLEFYRGIITHENLGCMYEVTRWSEMAVRQALQRYLYQIRNRSVPNE